MSQSLVRWSLVLAGVLAGLSSAWSEDATTSPSDLAPWGVAPWNGPGAVGPAGPAPVPSSLYDPIVPPELTHAADPSRWLSNSTATHGLAEPRRQSGWYTREDYFHWNERLNGADFVTEDGLLLTLGYLKRVGVERYRVEAFGGNMTAGSDLVFDDGSLEHNTSQTGYIGARAEYDLLWEPVSFPSVTLFSGIGTRFWFRDLRDDITPSGVFLMGYQETWWTFYPYLGGEKRWTADSGLEFYLNGRLGLTPFTYEHVTINDVTLHPRCGLTANMESGFRFSHLFVAGYWEALTWGESGARRDSWQPMSRMYTVGLKAGWLF